ncbi:MAG: hypothetical protein ACTHM5_12850 [Ginsengibacter sp.]
MKLTEYFLKVCESCLPGVKKNLKLVDPFGSRPTNIYDSYFVFLVSKQRLKCGPEIPFIQISDKYKYYP